MQINWRVFRPLNITERHVSHAPTSGKPVSDVVHVLEWVIPFSEQLVGLVCEKKATALEVIRFIASYLYTSRIIYLSEHWDASSLIEDLTPERRKRVDAVLCKLDNPPIRHRTLSTLILIALGDKLSMSLYDALNISPSGLILVVDPRQYISTFSIQLRSLEGYAVGYVDTKWVLVSLNKRFSS
ncbi:hypothetical protein B9Q08_02950 [Candidatus Marsarchaeota G2 archaeon ECH_B_SAG-M15]|uniref:Uncharacterized protein n=1 Tax=Candidatus Marsarchaeota G2 archaeon ECH_B_SAG-M15 TaxID=1978162 RepID=A0A2R6AYG0_9ARCH|nr:MAG: hypothetical protein B9Q08_02950 [Candidatus Marsarchaeota G2 archaeon ECH_B_SAG-M15]